MTRTPPADDIPARTLPPLRPRASPSEAPLPLPTQTPEPFQPWRQLLSPSVIVDHRRGDARAPHCLQGPVPQHQEVRRCPSRERQLEVRPSVEGNIKTESLHESRGSFKRQQSASRVKCEPSPSTTVAKMSQSPVTEGPPETPKASAKTPESAKFSSPQVPNDNAATTPRRALPSSRSESQAESSKETPKLAAVPGKKRKSPSKPDGAAAPKAPKLEPADSPCAVDKAIPDTALPSPKTPTVAEAAKDCPAGNEAEPAEAENADDNGGQQPPETPQKGAKPARKPRVNATKAQLTELLKKFEEVNDIVGRHEERFVKQAERVRKLERETRNMSSSLHRLRRWVTVAQSQGAPVPPEIWDELRKSYTAKKETKAAETAQADATANTGENGLDGSACAEDTESEGKAETESDENPRLGEE